MPVSGTDWHEWHEKYEDPDSSRSHRLRSVQAQIGAWLDRRPEPSLRVVSICAGQGRDLFGALASRPDAGRVHGTLVELDPRNVVEARQRASTLDSRIAVLEADAGDLRTYEGLVPADLVLLVGVLGNITDADVEHAVRSMPMFCAEGATVIWTRTRKPPDLNPCIRDWFAETGFSERTFVAPDGYLFTVGVHELTTPPRRLPPSGHLFRFVR